MSSMNAILVCVDYSDIAQYTIKYNRHHFNTVCMVTTPDDVKSQQLANETECLLFITDAFTRNGATFNKWLALEEGLDYLGRTGFISVMDADILWPKDLKGWQPEKSYLYTPLRHMHEDLRQRFAVVKGPVEQGQLISQSQIEHSLIPPEDIWWQFPTHRNIAEWSGYTHIFHADDPYLGKPPWYETNWKHAGGADSFFQLKWPLIYKRRPPWNCMHLGSSGKNWCGRSTPYVDGTVNPQSAVREMRLRDFIRQRQTGPGRFDHEMIDQDDID